jgi:hypothetical protein
MLGFFKKKNQPKMFRGWDVHFNANQHNIDELVELQQAMHEKLYHTEEILKISNILGYDIEQIAVFEPIESRQMFLSMGSASLVKAVRDFDLNYHPVTGEDTPKEVVSEAFEFLKAQSIIIGNENIANELEKMSWPKAHKILFDKGVVMVHTFEFFELSILTLMIEGIKRGACLFEVNEDGSTKVMPYSRRQE